MPERRLEAEHFERLGEVDVVALGDAVVRVEVEGDVVDGGLVVFVQVTRSRSHALCLSVSMVRSRS